MRVFFFLKKIIYIYIHIKCSILVNNPAKNFPGKMTSRLMEFIGFSDGNIQGSNPTPLIKMYKKKKSWSLKWQTHSTILGEDNPDPRSNGLYLLPVCQKL